ncbi:MAG: discoidin domain-containing protein [Bacteroidaceae bacterium]|nr:discoidin domain-containing protein [Bacteroidaceae bacterium]
MKKFTLLFAMLIGIFSSAWAQMVDLAIDRTAWTVTAYANPTAAIEGSADGRQEAMLDGNSSTYFHSAWGSKPANQSGDDATQAFLIDMAQEETISKIDLLPRGNGAGAPLAWRIYVYGQDETPVDLKTLTSANVQSSLSETALGSPTLSGNWADDASLKTATFNEPVTGRYILFVADDRHHSDAKWLCVAEFNAYTQVEEGAAAKIALHNAIVAAGNLTTGTGFATYDATQVTNAIADAQAVYDNEPTKVEAENAIAALNVALLAADHTPGNWTMKTNGRSGNNYLGYSGNLKGTASTAANADVITFEATEIAGQYILYIGENYFTNCTQSTQVGVTTDKASAQTYQVAKNSDGTFGVQSTDGGAYQWFHMAGAMNLVGWDQTADASKWVVEEIKTYVTITYQIKNGEEVIWQKDVDGAVGYAYPECQVNPWVSVVAPEGTVSVSETKVVDYVSSIKTFDNVADVDQWYTLDLHSNESNYQVYNNEGNIRVVDNGTSTSYQGGEVNAKYAWAFIGNPVTGVRVYNNEAEKFVVQPSDGDVEIVFGDEGSLFQVCTTTSGIANSFALKVDGRSYYINHRQPKIQGWTAADAGSSFRAWAVDLAQYADLTAMNAAIDKLNSKNIGTALGEYHETSEGAKAAALQAAAQFDETTPASEQAAVDAATQALNNAVTINLPTAGEYLRIKGTYYSDYIGNSLATNEKYSRTTDADEAIVYFDGTTLRNVSTGKYYAVTSSSWAWGDTKESASAIEFGSAIVGKYTVKCANIYLYDADGYVDRGQSPSMSSANQYNSWILEKADASVANMRITNAGWATFWAPFAVDIPAGVKAYTGEMQQGWIRMNELTEGYIPANTGVVVEGEPFEADLEPKNPQPNEADAESCYTGNTTGTTMAMEVGDYLLQKQNDVVGWYKVSGEGFTLARNRCYLAKNTVPEASQSRTFFGFAPDDATGINSIATEAKTKADGKYMVNGQIVVVKAGKAYNMSGAEIK